MAALRTHGETSAEVAEKGFLCIVNLTYLNAEFLAVNGRIFGDAGACLGELCSSFISSEAKTLTEFLLQLL